MFRKFALYERYGVEEYYIYNPYNFDFSSWQWDKQANRLALIDPIDGFISPRLGVRFDAPGDRELIVYRADDSRFETPLEIRQKLEQAETSRATAEAERDAVTLERDLLAAKLRELGIDPATL